MNEPADQDLRVSPPPRCRAKTTMTNPAADPATVATVVSRTRSAARFRKEAGVRAAANSSGTPPRWPSSQPAYQISATRGASISRSLMQILSHLAAMAAM
jgi:hypothetical protein